MKKRRIRKFKLLVLFSVLDYSNKKNRVLKPIYVDDFLTTEKDERLSQNVIPGYLKLIEN